MRRLRGVHRLCEFAAVSVDDGLAEIDAAACMGCGVCVAHCPQGAIELMREPAKGEPLEIQKLIERPRRWCKVSWYGVEQLTKNKILTESSDEGLNPLGCRAHA